MKLRIALVATLLVFAGGSVAVSSWTPPDLDHTFLATPWGYVRADYQPPAPGTHAIFFMEGYMGASTPANGLDYEGPAPKPTHPTHYVRMPDGVLIGVTVHHEFSGLLQDHGFALVMASVRGTGCSGGTFDLFDKAHREDGRRLIEWIATQPGFEPEVALFGASYSGITALLVASERPANLAAVSANMVLGDLYRDIAYPGGVPNIAFPGLWTVGFRPAQDHLGTLGGALELDEICLRNQAMHFASTDHAGVGMYSRRWDDTMYRVRSPVEFTHLIDVPIVMGQSFQDEQTGPRGGFTVWPTLAPSPVQDPCGAPGETYVPRHMVLTNGVHGTSTDNSLYYALPWFKLWIKGDASGYGEGLGFCDFFGDPVRVLWEKRGDFVHADADGPATYTHAGNVAATTGYAAFPVPGTDWQDWRLCGDGALAAPGEAACSGAPRAYVHADQRAGSWNYGSGGRAREGSEFTARSGPDLLRYRSAPLGDAVTVLGPITLRLVASTSAPDTEFFVTLGDVAPDGSVTYLQKGMLKATHRALDPTRAWYEGERLVRPSYMHTSASTTSFVEPGAPVEYVIDVFPLGHVFREGHRVQLQVHAPPQLDGRWGYGPMSPPATNVVHGGALTLPVVPAVDVGDWPGCGVPDGYRCVPAAHHQGV
ncbi:MAG TPA: CocE/NonD family hydrolase [Candidatus Thermoplasmatota archaeon]|nr:CocE/NonD family hydrolase [Candidatus Thermoplasmatota archaeon]